MSKHTPEPWASYHGTTPGLGETVIIGPAGAELQTFQPGICVVTDVESMTDEDVANARRICAAVNACKGISTDRLEKMVPGTLANLLTLKGEKK